MSAADHPESLVDASAQPATPRIAYLTSEYPTPSHTFIRREVASLREQGLDIHTYSIRYPAHPLDNEIDRTATSETTYVLEQGVLAVIEAQVATFFASPVQFLRALRLALKHRVPGLRAAIWSLFHFAEAMILARQLRKAGVTRLHNHFANPAASVGVIAAHYLRIPWSVTLHGISEFDYPAGHLLPEKLELAEFAACVSYFGKAQAMRLVDPAVWSKLHLVRCGIDQSILPERQPRRDGETLHIVCVGRTSPEKGQNGLIDTVAKLRASGRKLHLTLVGEGPQEAALQAYIEQLGLADDIHMTGRLDEIGALKKIAKADILVLPSFMEGLPIVLMEALALEVPVIASRVAGIPELVIDGETGLLFDPANWDGLEMQVAELCDDAELRGSLAAAGKQKVEREFSYPAAAKPLVRLFGHETGA